MLNIPYICNGTIWSGLDKIKLINDFFDVIINTQFRESWDFQTSAMGYMLVVILRMKHLRIWGTPSHFQKSSKNFKIEFVGNWTKNSQNKHDLLNEKYSFSTCFKGLRQCKSIKFLPGDDKRITVRCLTIWTIK